MTRRSASRLPLRPTLLRLAACLGLLGSAATLPAQGPAVGLHSGSDFATAQYEAFGAWLGRDVMYRVVFIDKADWSTFSGAAVLETSRKWIQSKPGRVEVVSLGMWANGHKGGFATILNGSKDAVFRSIAERIHALGITKHVIIRLAWESNGDWYSWSCQPDPASFKATWRRIVGIMRAAAPGLRFEFNISNLANRMLNGAKWTAAYPGDDVVDVISMDIYDHWNSWSTMVHGDAGLKEMRDFAIARNKPEAYSEWALVTSPNGHGDNPAFIRSMAAWMNARPGKVLYHAYWNTTGGGRIFSPTGSTVPKGAAAYREMFGRVATASPGNKAPTITGIADRTIAVNGSTGTIRFRVGDAETPVSSLKLIRNSSDPSLIPPSRIVLGGSGADRTVTISPVPNKTGWATIWLKVDDGVSTRVESFVVTVAARLTFCDVGRPAGASRSTQSGSSFTITSGGDDIYQRSDNFHYGSAWLSGDTELTVRVADLTATDPWTKAGLMFRTNGASNAAFVAVFVTPAKGVVLQWRSAAGDWATSSAALPGRAPRWLRLVRSADSFYAFASSDGVDWDFVETTRVVLPRTCLAGIALTAHTPSSQATAVFERLSVD